MKTYRVSFKGREKNAIGIFYKINTTVEASETATEDEIRLKLYNRFEHISEFKILNK